MIHEVELIRRGGVEVDTGQAEVDELCLGQFCREVVVEESLITEEGVDLVPSGGAGKDDTVIYVHAEGGLRGSTDASKERGGVQG